MTERQKTCAERIDEHQKSREDYLAALYAIANGEPGEVDGEELDEESAAERIDELPLGVSTYTVLRIDLSTGGPADYLTAHLFKERYGYGVESVTYHFADWFDHAEQSVSEDSPLWTLAERYAECLEA
jgi:hypothetical protein